MISFQRIISFKTVLLMSVALVAHASSSEPAAAVRASLPDQKLDALVAEAIARAPEMVSARSSFEAAQFRITPSETLPDPFVSASYQNDGRSLSLGDREGSFIGIMASQTFPWPGKLGLAGDMARSEAEEIESQLVGRSALSIEARVRNAWYDLVLARAIDRILDDRFVAAGQIEASVRERYAVGLAVQQDVLRAQIELARLEEQRIAQSATIVSRIAELNRLVSAPQDRAVETAAALPEDTAVAPLQELLSAAAARSPELAASGHAIETGRLRVDLAKKDFLPDLVVSAGSMDRGSFEMGPMWQVGIGVTLPLWIERRQQNRLGEAQAIVIGRTADRDALARELELRTRERAAQLDASLRIAALYRDTILPLDEVSLESALASYQAGRVPFITVLDALNTLYSDRAIYAGRLTESAKWRVAIDEASLQ
ncbi:MAG TPA: TolC family protein [Thermoanaerobaculia bacterium]|nr:TolC family protein [Thermoanaerobaculia bacterium]